MRSDANNPLMRDEQLRMALAELTRGDSPLPAKLALLKAIRESGREAAEHLDKALIAEVTDLRRAVHESQQSLGQLRAKIEDLVAPPFFLARCLAITETSRGTEACVTVNGQSRMVLVDQECDWTEMSVGKEVLLSQNLNRVLAVSPKSPLYGETAVLDRVAEDGSFLVSLRGEIRTVVPASSLRGQPPRKGSLLQLDATSTFALSAIPGSSGEEYLIQETPAVSFADIGGLDPEIRRIEDLILLHSHHAGLARKYHLPRANSILLAGKTGSGKTMLAQATCRFLAGLSGGRGRFLFVGPGDLKDMYYGQTEKRIRNLFSAARAAAERDSSPLVIFFDEVDAYLSKRTNLHNPVHDEVTAALLSEMDGFEKHENVWLLAATNRLHVLDAAAVRGSRFGDNIITFGPLRRAGARDIFGKHLPATLPFQNGDAASLIDSAVSVLYTPNGDNKIAAIQLRDGTKRTVVAKDLLSGAEIAKICRLAKERAAKREIEQGSSGVCRKDLMAGIERFLEESAAKLKPHNCHDYISDLPDDLDVVKVEAVQRLNTSRVMVA